MQKRFIDEKCSVCGESFAEDDELTVCPECGAPYHKDCYKMSGQCVHKDEHGSYEWKGEKEKLSEHYINLMNTAVNEADAAEMRRLAEFLTESKRSRTEQGGTHGVSGTNGNGGANDTKNTDRGGFNGIDGIDGESDLHGMKDRQEFGGMPFGDERRGDDLFTEDDFAPIEDFPSVSERDMKAYLGDTASYFLPAYRQMKEKGRMLHLNFRAFFLSFFYIFYKRMYGFAWGLLFMMSFAFSIFSVIRHYDFSSTTPTAQGVMHGILILLVVMIALYPLLFFDYCYLKAAARKIKMMRRMFRRSAAEEIERQLRREGRSSFLSCLCGTVVFLYLLVITKTVFTSFLISLLAQ